MVMLKQVSLRLKSIKNIQKITKTMKMVAASKFTKIERELRHARPFGYGPRKFYESSALMKDATTAKLNKDKTADSPHSQPPKEGEPPKDLKGKSKNAIYIAVTSDRGLCGGVHSGVARKIRKAIADRKADPKDNKLLCIGDKSRAMLRRQFPQHMLLSVKDVGRQAPVFKDAAEIATALSFVDYKYDFGELYYNKYYSPVKYELSVIPFFNKYYIEAAPRMHIFDDIEEDQLESYAEWTLAAIVFYSLKESAASEQSARMSAMDNATKNADEMIRKLTLLYNRTRQAVITRELIEIISGAAALK